MKNYIGVKIIKAKPMTREAAFLARDTVCPNGGEDDPGYLVEYPDGYKSWSPKEAFEAAYFEMDENPSTVTLDMVERFRGPIFSNRIDAKTTHVHAESMTGFVQHEVSSCVDPKNYDHEIGVQIGTDRINNTFWMCLGFVLQWGRFGLKK